VTVRPAREEDRAAIAEIQRASPDASQWDPEGFDVTVAEVDGRVVGFLVTRAIADEVEILNLAVNPANRRSGVARALLQPLLERPSLTLFLEVRESNTAARTLYQALRFQEVSRRRGYYEFPPGDGIVMKFHSC
jgi:[ribosomal protein S18]-alanine N-acetyltransferase